MKYKFKTTPYKHQLKALETSWNKETYAYFMEMGTGKTKVLIDNMLKLKQQTFVCAPSPMQHALVGAYDIDISPLLEQFMSRRNLVVEALGDVTDVCIPEGAFYAFPKIPESLGITGTEFVSKAITQEVLVIQGNVFSKRDTHFRISFAVEDEKLERGLSTLRKLLV